MEKRKTDLKKLLEKMKKGNMIVAYCCCGNSRTRSTGNSNSYNTSGC